MDDPWGSPWANDGDDPSKNNPLPRSPPKASTLLEPPPRAILSSSPPKLTSITSHSPWADDDGDGFGDWTTPARDASPSVGGGAGWGGWTTSEHSAASSQQQLTPIPRRDSMLGGASSIAWPGSIATAASPSLSPPKRAADSLSLRQPSPDPWAAEFTLDRQEEQVIVADTSSERPRKSGDDTTAKDVEERDTENGESPEPGMEERGRPGNSNDYTTVNGGAEERDDEDGGPQEPEIEEARGRSAHSKRLSGAHDAPSLAAEQDSRPSSSGSDGSHHDDRGQESPITSIDEDSKMRPKLTQGRKVSNKVLDLVHMYDEIGRKIETEDAELSQKAAMTRERSHGSRSRPRESGADEDMDDFGGFEDVESEDDAVKQPETEPDMKTPDARPPRAVAERPTTPHSRKASRQTSLETPGSQPSPATQKAVSSAFKDLLAKYGKVSYNPDLGLTAQLFPDLPPLPERDDSALPFYVPDHIIDDSFTSMSERKTWYRISRHGSSRKHDAGADDENYKRIAWPVSRVRTDTILIVRRWMEEDSFTGRATLGGIGSKVKGNVFGWDSSAEPVALDEVFKKKRKSLPAKPRSEFALAPPAIAPNAGVNGPSATPVQNVVLDATSSRPSVSALHAAPSLASFGAPEHVVAIKGPTNHLTAPRPMSMPPQVFNAQPASGVPEADDEDDDDWGEMISSPQETFFSSAPPVVSSEQVVSPLVVKTLVASTNPALHEENGSATRKSAPAQDPFPTSQASHNGFSDMDFSIFESPNPANTKPNAPSHTSTPTMAQPGPPPALAKAEMITCPVSQIPRLSQKDEAIVQSILRRLPNLSYMLR